MPDSPTPVSIELCSGSEGAGVCQVATGPAFADVCRESSKSSKFSAKHVAKRCVLASPCRRQRRLLRQKLHHPSRLRLFAADRVQGPSDRCC